MACHYPKSVSHTGMPEELFMEVLSLGSDLLPIPLYFAVFLVGVSDVELAILSYDPPFPD